MDVPALMTIVADAILAHCPQYDRARVMTTLELVFAGHPALLGDNTISMLFGQNNDFTTATVTIGDVHAGHTINVHLPQPIDPALAALIARASLPATIHHGNMTINESGVSGVVVRDNHGTINQTIHQHQPLDPLPAALAALASLPLDHVPEPRADLPHASRLPFEASPHFVGREEALKRLAAAIGTAQPAVVMPAVATGLGGIGKTSLVTEFAYRYGVYFQGGVFWLNCADPDQVASQIAACAVGLKLDTTGLSLDEQVQRVLHAWQSPMPRLLIFDNCEDPAILDQWKPTVGGCRVLVTARSDQWPTLTQIRLGLLSPVESRALLQRLCERLSDAEADAIAEDLGHLPLALHLAGSYLETYSHHTVAQYRTDLTIAHRSLKGRGALPSPTRHEHDVEATFMLSFNQLDPKKPIDVLALGMLDGAAWCAPGVPIPRDLVLAFVPDGTDADDSVDALRRLQQLGLLDGADAVVLHRLLVQFVQAQLKVLETRERMEDCINQFAVQANATGIPNRMIPLGSHLRYVTLKALEDRSRLAYRLAISLGYFERSRGDYTTAQQLYQQALVITEQDLGIMHPQTATIMSNLASVLSEQGQYQEAQLLHERALKIREYTLGTEHQDTAGSIHNFGGMLYRQARYREAQGWFERALKIRQRILGIKHPDTAASMDALALVLLEQGQYAEGQLLFEQALNITEQVYGTMHPTTARIMNNLAGMMVKRGFYPEAQAWFERALVVNEVVLGKEHPKTAESMSNVAMMLEKQERYDEAESVFKQVMTIMIYVFGMLHPNTAASFNNVAFVLMQQSAYNEAQLLFEQALDIREKTLGMLHPVTGQSVSNLALLLKRQGQYSESKLLYERALMISQEVYGREHGDTASSMNDLAALLVLQQQYDRADSLFRQALQINLRIFGDSHPHTRRVRKNLEWLKSVQSEDGHS